ncbi:DGQHR domain-containing protein DpdB [Brevundimonas nasdae]|uniref:DGQHR domain-containing protein n=1 Tax=Brevundimonas nasdae TaxID=172043 RepID=A0ABX8TJU8_9CAUL|nr:DGQHR domain-containing protein DpdB [Brevundimonas nasdae]QYC11498.1 DGQHR domain-containing protein [Brevundimonas nasdae]QYC14286.1 DGQHR domain-containing protein [Brevundimonas nasdae]
MSKVVVRALKTHQGSDVAVYAFFVPGDQVAELADISRLKRADGELEGFQRREIKTHVAEIAEFLKQGQVLFPNAIILALSSDVRFKSSRGPSGEDGQVRSGELTLPLRPAGQRAAWVVDGQQRSLALAKAGRADLLVPVIAFQSDDVTARREQFILVNKAKPLSPRLIDELLPEMGVNLPRSLKPRQAPSELCTALNDDPASPFFGLVKRESQPNSPTGVVTDSALAKAIRLNLRPGGALGAYDGDGGLEAAYQALVDYWSAVRDAFPEAWGKPSTESRLMHAAGIQVMGALMDPIWTRADATSDPKAAVAAALARLAPRCCWVDGVWEDLNWPWNEVQATTRHIKGLSDLLLKLDRDLSRPAR